MPPQGGIRKHVNISNKNKHHGQSSSNSSLEKEKSETENEKNGSYKIYLNKQKDLMAKKQPKEMLEKMSDEQKDEVLKKKPRRD